MSTTLDVPSPRSRSYKQAKRVLAEKRRRAEKSIRRAQGVLRILATVSETHSYHADAWPSLQASRIALESLDRALTAFAVAQQKADA